MEILKQKCKYYFEKLLTLLRVRPIVAGLEISDSTVRLAYFDGQAWHVGGIRLEPGIVENGRVKDKSRFIEAVASLKLQVFGKNYENKKVSVIASLSSVKIYSQVFSLPIIKGENLEKAVQLNVQMVSPVDVAQSYSGWQTVGEDQRSLRLEILSAFIERPIVDELNAALLAAGFLLIALESRAVSLSRVLREQGVGVDAEKPYIMVSVDDSGIDFLIIRHGQPYFEYFNLWREIAGDKGQISTESFGAAITRSLYQVLNFYTQHWPETVSEVIISAVVMRDEISKAITDSFPLTTRYLQSNLDGSIGPEWYVAIGCGARGAKPRARDRDMSLLGIGAEEEFRREQLAGFVGFWRLLMPVALSLILVSFFLSDLFLIQTRKALESKSLFNLSSVQAQENQSLQAEAQDFNRTVGFILAVEKDSLRKSDIVEKINRFLANNNAAANRISFPSLDTPITLSGEAKSEEGVTLFKKSVEQDAGFKEVDLPLSDIRVQPSGVSFSMRFSVQNPAKSKNSESTIQ